MRKDYCANIILEALVAYFTTSASFLVIQKSGCKKEKKWPPKKLNANKVK